MALKTFLIMTLLLTAVAYPQAKAQLGNNVNGLPGLIIIRGTVSCPPNAHMAKKDTAPQAAKGPIVKLQCGGETVLTVTANEKGEFTIVVDPLQLIVFSLLEGCNLVVTPPFLNCNSTHHPSFRSLVSPLQHVGNSVLGGNLVVANVVPSGFEFTRPNN